MKKILFALSLLIAAPASADTFLIPAEEFDWHTYPLDMAGYTEDAELENIRELRYGEQLHIRYWIDAELNNYVTNLERGGISFQVCATVANRDKRKTNLVRINHPNPAYNHAHEIVSNQYKTVCSKQGKLGDVLRSGGVKVLSTNQGPVEVRNVSFRAIQEAGQLTTATTASWDLDLARSAGRAPFETNEQAWAVLTIGNVVYVGGEFQNIKKGDRSAFTPRKYIAAFDRNTGEPVPNFNIELDGRVSTLASSPNNDTLYIGGDFNTANGESRKKFAAYNIASNRAILTNFRLKLDGTNISPNRSIRDIAVTNDRLYLGGPFTKFGGNEDYAHAAAFNRNSGEIVKTFKPKPNGRVTSIIGGGNEGLWIGGDFKKVNGISKVGLALLDHNTGDLLPSSPTVPYPVIDLAATATQLFVAGGGQNRKGRFTGNIASAFDRNSLVMQWELVGDGNVQAVDVDRGRYVYFGGHYQRFRHIRNSKTDSNGVWVKGGENVERLSRHDKVTGEIDFTWLPFVNGIRSVNGIDVTTNGLYIVGDFLNVGGDTTTRDDPRKKDHRGFAIFDGATN